MILYQSAALLMLAACSLTVDAFAPSISKHESISSASSTTITDLTQVGSLTVPQIGCGTIAWSTDKGEKIVANSIGVAFITCAHSYNHIFASHPHQRISPIHH